MQLVIHFSDARAGEVTLRKGKRIIDRAGFCLERNLEEVLIESIDKILERNKMDLFTLKIGKGGGKLDEQGLTYQLVSSFQKALIL